MAPTSPDPGQLHLLRTWRTWLLIAVSVGQAAQYLAAPDRALSTSAYRLLEPIGATGWRVFSVLLVICAALLIPLETRRYGHGLGAVLYLGLFWATVLNGYWPSLAVLAGGLHCGEFWLWQRSIRRGG